MRRVGLIADTHGLLRPEAVDFLRGADHIIHGGDIGNAAILAELAAIAPLTAVRGNNDREPWAAALPHAATVDIGGVAIYVVHDIAECAADLARVRAVVSGHSHQPGLREADGVLFINPGSAGRRRFRLPVSVGELIVEDGAVRGRIELLAV
jgi:uncharacterized protein